MHMATAWLIWPCIRVSATVLTKICHTGQLQRRLCVCVGALWGGIQSGVDADEHVRTGRATRRDAVSDKESVQQRVVPREQ